MQWDQRSVRFGVGFLVTALLLRLVSASPLGETAQWPGPEELVAAMLFLETGRVVRLSEPAPTEPPVLPTEYTEALVEMDPQLPLVFSREDLALLEIKNTAGLSFDPAALLQKGTVWELTQEGPAVLIIHTHGTESYQNTQNYVETAQFRTLDENHNMIAIGKELARRLEGGGIQVIHDTALYDYPSYSDAYDLSRQAIQAYLEDYPSIRLVLDLHRDAAEDALGNQVAYTSQLGGETAAQLMLVAGSDAGGLQYPNWQENLTLALQLQIALQRLCPGICRPLNLRAQRYNQDLHSGALLVEVGAAGNTQQEALLAAGVLAQGILDIAHGTAYAQSTP